MARVAVYADRFDNGELVVHAFVSLDGASPTFTAASVGLDVALAGYGIDDDGNRYDLDTTDQDALRFTGLHEATDLHVTVRGRPLRTRVELNHDVDPADIDPPRHTPTGDEVTAPWIRGRYS